MDGHVTRLQCDCVVWQIMVSVERVLRVRSTSSLYNTWAPQNVVVYVDWDSQVYNNSHVTK